MPREMDEVTCDTRAWAPSVPPLECAHELEVRHRRGLRLAGRDDFAGADAPCKLGFLARMRKGDPRDPMLFHRTVGLRDEWATIQKRSS